jgi:hypothetical protein
LAISVLSDFAQRNDKRSGGGKECKRDDHEYQIVHSCFSMLGEDREAADVPLDQNFSGLISA